MNIIEPTIDTSDDNGDAVMFAYLSQDRAKAAMRGAMWSAFNSLIPAALNGIVFVVSSRYLLPSDFGSFALALSIVIFVSVLGPTAFGEALIQRQVIRRSHLDSVFWLTVAFAALLYGGVFVFAPFLAAMVHQPAIASILRIVGLKIVFDMLAVVPNALIARKMIFHILVIRTAISTTISAIVCLSILFAGYGIWALAFAQIAGSIAACVAAYWGAGWMPGLNLRGSSMRAIARYGTFASVNRLVQSANLDQLVIGLLVSPGALGIYNFARRMFQMLNDLVSGGLNSVSHVLLSSLQDDQAKVRDAFLMATFGCSLVAFPVFMGLAAVADDLIPLVFGPQWAAAVWPVRFFCVIGLMSGIGIIQASLINSQGRSDWWLYYQLVRNIFTIASVLLLYRHGISAIVLAIMIQTIILWPVTLWMVSRLIALSILGYVGQFMRPVLAYCGLLAAVLLLGSVDGRWPVVLRLAAEIAAGGAAYLILIGLLCGAQIRVLISLIINRRGKPVAEPH